MKLLHVMIPTLGTVAVLSFVVGVMASAITYVPAAEAGARQFIFTALGASLGAALATLLLSVIAVPLAAAAGASRLGPLRRLGLWLSLPPLLLGLLFFASSMG